MESLLNKFDEIVSLIENSPKYCDYLDSKEKLKDNDEVMSLIGKIKKLQKEAVKKEYNKIPFDEEDEEIRLCLSKLNEIPIYVDYINKQGQINEELMLIKEKLEKYIEEVVS